MTAPVDLRLSGMMRAVQEVILPAVADDGYAREQAMLLLGHLAVLRGQIDLLPRYEALQLEAARQYGAALSADLQDDERTRAAKSSLNAAVAAKAECPAAVRAATDAIHAAAETLLRTLACVDDEAAAKTAEDRSVAYGKACADRDRSWFSAMGFEASGADVASPSRMLTDMEAALL